MKSPRCTPAAVATFLLASAFALPASADPRHSAAPGIIGEAERWITGAVLGPTVASEPTARPRSATAERDVTDATRGKGQQPFVDLSPNASIVARDWRGSMKIVGARTMLVDDLRPTASQRMVMGRLSTDGRLSTFVQAGLGEWRIDSVMFPNARSSAETAGQVGTGFELRLPSSLRLAGEAQYTMLYRDDLHYTPDEVAPRILSVVVAIDGRF